MKFVVAALALVLTCSFAHAQEEEAPTKSYEGLFTFNWKRTETAKCMQIGPKINKTLTSKYTICRPPDKGTNGPRKCTVAKDREYLVFQSMTDCKTELEAQIEANAEFNKDAKK